MHRLRIIIGLCVSLLGSAYAEPQTDTVTLEQAEAGFAAGNYAEVKPHYQALFNQALLHSVAYGRLVEIALHERDTQTLTHLMAAHNAFPFDAPQQFQSRVQFFELNRLRKVYNQALQADLSRDWKTAEQGYAQLLGDPAFHRQAVNGLFRSAMRQKDFERARYIATLAERAGPDPVSSADLLEACALQRADQRDAARTAVKRVLDTRADAAWQQKVYLAMIRLHVELDQCFRHVWLAPREARPFFPDLPDAVLSYLARP